MGLQSSEDSQTRFAAYAEQIAGVLGHVGLERPLRDYCAGLMMTCPRKSVEPMAAITAPKRVRAPHKSLVHFVSKARWSDEKVLGQVRDYVLAKMEHNEPIQAWILDDPGIPKKGRHSVGVARQYCGQLGKQDNCQVAVSLSVANHRASLPAAYRLYPTKEWAADQDRRRDAGVPADVTFKTKPKIALDHLRWACAAGLPRGPVLMDVAYGTDTHLRTSITALGLTYAAGIPETTTVWAPGTEPLTPKPYSGRGRPPKRLSRNGRRPITVKTLALGLPEQAWHTITWREGTAGAMSSCFTRVRVRPAHRDHKLTAARPNEWLLIAWPQGEREPTKYWLSTLAHDIDFDQRVDSAKLRWRIERGYQELKQELGLGHFEGRSWRGFHHHATLTIAAYGFLVSERETFPPSGPRTSTLFPRLTLPENYRPRGAADPA